MWTRREVLQLAGVSAFSLAAGAAEAAPKRSRAKLGTVIGPGFLMDPDTRQKSFVLALVDLDAKKRERAEISVGFFAHGMTPNPVAPERAVLFEKKGPGACEVDLVRRKVLRTITTTADRRFYGHGAYSADGSILYATESVVSDRYKGVIAVRDGKTFEVRGLFPTYGDSPHDCRLIDGGRILVITNGGGDLSGTPPSVTYVDVASEKLIEKLELETPRLNTGHLAISSRGELAVVSAPRDGIPRPETERGGVSLRRSAGKLLTMTEPRDITARMLGETLSVVIHEPSGVVAATNPMGHVVTFWDLKTQRFLRSFEFPHPRGVALSLDQKSFIVSYAPESKLIEIDAQSLSANDASIFEPSYMSGSHIITYDLSKLG
jgi:hypothetical protein